jgi:hypothetical protein
VIQATKTQTKKKAKKVGRHERCTICHFPFGTGTCDSCRDPKCDQCGLRLLTVEREKGSKCANCSEDAAKYVRKVAKAGNRLVAIVLTGG